MRAIFDLAFAGDVRLECAQLTCLGSMGRRLGVALRSTPDATGIGETEAFAPNRASE